MHPDAASAKAAVWLQDKLPGIFCLPVCILCPLQPLKGWGKLQMFEEGWINDLSLNNNRECFVGGEWKEHALWLVLLFSLAVIGQFIDGGTAQGG